MHNLTATVAAVSTPPGKGGVALIRISGPDAVSIASRVFRPKSLHDFADTASNRAVYGDIYENGEQIDDGMAIIFRAPHSYTGEDTVEMTCHGGILLTRTVLSAILTAGAALADAGEFTERAFVNGRLTLSDAEGIASLIEAESRSEIRLSAEGSRSRLSSAFADIHRELTAVMASLFASIDFPDEDLASLDRETLTAKLRATEEKVNALLATYRTGRAVTEGIRTAIVGKPNVGKSSLYNLFAGEDLAIVTDIPGTTRDVLSETVSVGRVKLRLRDTAGLRETDDPVEKIGVMRSRSCLEESELCFAVFDASSPLSEEDLKLIDDLRAFRGTVIAVVNKCDLPVKIDRSIIDAAFPNTVTFSAKTGDLCEIEALLDRLFTDEKLTVGEDAILSGTRRYAVLCRASEALGNACVSAESGLPEDLIANDLELAIGALGELDGRAVSEEIVSEIFSHFCVGK